MSVESEALARIAANPDVADGKTPAYLMAACVEHLKATTALNFPKYLRDEVGNVLGLQDNTSTFPLLRAYLWASKPLASSVDVGTIIRIMDVGGDGGSLWSATLAGWVPLNGVVTLASNWGTLAAPVATQTGSAGTLFVPAGGVGSLVVPTSMLLDGRSKLETEVLLRRRGTNATGQYSVYLGTAGTTSDSLLYTIQAAATNNLDTRILTSAGFNEGVMTTSNYQAPGSAAGVFQDRTTNVNLAAAMTISIGVSSANSLDAFDLIGYSIKLVSM